MKKVIFNFLILIAACMLNPLNLIGQERGIDTRTQMEQQDPLDMLKSEGMTTLDILNMLDFAGIKMKKFDLGSFAQPYQLHVFAEKIVDGKTTEIDTLLAYNNQYYFPDKDGKFKYDFINQIRLLTQTDDNQSFISIKTNAVSTRKTNITLPKEDNRQFFLWRDFVHQPWQLNQNIPLMLFGAAWYDKAIDNYRFCGTVNLAQEEEATKKLIADLPAYIIISYKITEIEKI